MFCSQRYRKVIHNPSPQRQKSSPSICQISAPPLGCWFKMAEDSKGKKIWDRGAWRDAAFFLRYLKPHARVFIPAMVALALTSCLTIAFVQLLSRIVGEGLAGAKGPEWQQQLTETSLWLIAIIAAQSTVAFFRIMLFAKAAERALCTLRREAFSHIIRLPMATLGRHRVGELGSRLANDVDAMRETLVMTIPQLIRHSVILLGCLIFLLSISVKLALVMMGTIPVALLLIALFGSRIRSLVRRTQDQLAHSQVIVEEALQSMVSVKAFANENLESRRYDQHINAFLTQALRAAPMRAAFISFIIFSFSLALIAVAWYALQMLQAGEIATTALTLFGGVSALMASSFAQFPELMTQLQRTLGATDRVRELLAEATEELGNSEGIRLRGELRMEAIGFSYPGRPEVKVLREFNLEAAAGQRIALVGPSGSGKSTAIALAYRFYPPCSGRILYDGEPAETYDLAALRRNLALVPQEVLLFGGSIRDNIAYGRPGATDAEIETAAAQANAHAFIEALPEGYDTLVGERGTQLSGGQRQRIAIARAILADPAILILDEATSSLDAESERLVQDALDRLMAGRTSIIIAHRLSTVRRCDQILVLSGGTVIERGRHEELLAREGSLYGTLARLQLE
jgi:ATP-binding cassette subfamily B protein